MYGRYGMDELYRFLLYLYIILVCISLFLKVPHLFFLELLVFLFMFYRVFSKDIKRRKKENKIYLDIRNKIGKPFLNMKRNWNDRNDFVYKKCRHCKTTLRLPLPSERGIKHATCPKCKRGLKVLCLRKEKIEILKAKSVMKS